MKIAVGSQNKVKIEAVKAAAKQLFDNEPIEFVATNVASGVADQPMSDEETMSGAHNRAAAALQAVDGADFGVGLEGGLQKINDVWYVGNFACVVTKDGQVGYGISPRVTIPGPVMDQVIKGHDLTKSVEIALGIADIGKKEGMLGYMTKGHITRSLASQAAVLAALGSVLNSLDA